VTTDMRLDNKHEAVRVGSINQASKVVSTKFDRFPGQFRQTCDVLSTVVGPLPQSFLPCCHWLIAVFGAHQLPLHASCHYPINVLSTKARAESLWTTCTANCCLSTYVTKPFSCTRHDGSTTTCKSQARKRQFARGYK